MAIAQPANGLLVYQTDGDAGFYVNESNTSIPKWRPVQNNSSTNAAATNQWATQPLSYLEMSTGAPLQELAFDGEYVWGYRAVNGANNIFRVRASDGEDSSSISISGTPRKIFYDGTYIVILNETTLFRLNPKTGTIADHLTNKDLLNSKDVVFDGQRYWVVGEDSRVAVLYNNNLVLDVRESFNLCPTGFVAQDMLFDGKHLWALSRGAGNNRCIRKIDVATFTVVYTSLPGNNYAFPAPLQMAFDGVYIWVCNNTFSLEYYSASDGAFIDKFGVSYPDDGITNLRYDGDNLWLAGKTFGGANSNKTQKIAVADKLPVSINFERPYRLNFCSVVFDGKSIWISSYDLNNNGFLNKRPK
jgi:outer membrane lipoprotein-sorting protein